MSWRSQDSVVILASYLHRPRGRRLPPELEMQRLANLLRVPVEQVRERLDRFAAWDRGEAEPRPTPRDRRIFERYGDDPMRCAADAEWILQGRRWRPKWLYK